MAPAIPSGWHTVTPRLVVDEPDRLIAFLGEAFGSTGDHQPGAPSLMRIGDSIVMVSAAGPRAAMPALLYVYVEDADATYRRAVDAGAVSIEEPGDMPYGDRRAMVQDPCGNLWQIA